MKILITSDLHINDFRSHNIMGDQLFRLHQFEKLSERLVEIIKQENVQAVCIAGDFLHIASPRPYVVNAAGRFLKRIAASVPIYVTHGQHDFDSRTTMTSDNSLLSLYNNINNVHYVHKQSITLSDKKFYFQGWTPEQDFSQVKKYEYDILIGHVTVNGAVMNDFGTEVVGQDFENDKFKLCFVGDIHFPGTKGNIVIPGVPIQNNFGDNADNSVIILDTNDLSWKRIKTENAEHRFLKFLTTAKTYSDPYYITKLPGNSKALAQKENLTKSVDIVEVIDKYVKLEKLSSVHDKVMIVTSKLQTDEINLSYTIESLTIKNFKSIKDFSWTPALGISLLYGANGTGKSSLIEAIRFGLKGATSPKEFVTDDDPIPEMFVDIGVLYKGVSYRIVRGWKKSGYTRYYINGKEQEFENQKSLKGNKISQDLSFLDMYDDLLHRHQKSPYFLGNQTYAQRVDITSKIVGLSLVDKLKISAERLRSDVELPLKSITDEIFKLQNYIEAIKDLNFDDLNVSYEKEIAVLTDRQTQLTMLQTLESEFAVQTNESSRLKYGLDQFAHYDFNTSNIKDVDQLNAEMRNVNEQISKLNDQANDIQYKNNKIREEIATKQSSIVQFKKELLDLENKKSKITKNTCYTCAQVIDGHLTNKILHDINDNKLMNDDQLKKIAIQLPQLLDDLKNMSTEKDKVQKQLLTFIESKNSISSEIQALSEKTSAKNRFDLINAQFVAVEKTIQELDVKILKFRMLFNKKFSLILSEANHTITELNRIREQIFSYREKMVQQEKLRVLKNELQNRKLRLTNLEKEQSEIVNEKIKYDKYIGIMAPNGPVIRSVLTTISENLTTDKIKVIAYKTLASGETRPDFNLYLNVAGKWRNYDYLSGGQQISCDIFMIKNLVDLAGGAGSMIFDETFGQLDPESLEFVVETIKTMRVNHTFVVSHAENFPYYDNTIATIFDNTTGTTTYTIN